MACDHQKRIAIIGLPFLKYKNSNPLIPALTDYISKKNDWNVVLISETTIEAFRLLNEIKCDGVLARVVSKEIAAVARGLNCPTVNISSFLENPGVPTVRRDESAIGRMCAEHLVKKGFKRFAVVEMPYSDWCYRERSRRFAECVRKATPDASISVYRVNSEPLGPEGMSRFQEWVRTLVLPCALFLNDDSVLPEIMDGCYKAGIRIPHDLAVIAACFHPDMLAIFEGKVTHPPLDADALVTRACDYLDELMRNPCKRIRTIVVPHGELVTGESTDTTAVNEPMVAKAIQYIQEHSNEKINIKVMAEDLCINRRTLERRFAKTLGGSLYQYLTLRRISCAEELLGLSPRPSLREIANRSGFYNVRHMKRALESNSDS